MQSNPFLTLLKIAAFAVLAFLVGVSSCQKANLENKVTKLDESVGELSRQVGDLAREVKSGGGGRRGGGTGGEGGEGVSTARDLSHDRATLDAHLDPKKPVGTVGRYKDYLSDDPDPRVLPESAGHEDGEVTWPYGPEPRAFNPIIESDGQLSDLVLQYCGDQPADRHWRNPSKWHPAVCWRVEVSPDYKEWTLFFRDDVVWHTPTVDLRKYPHLAGTHNVTAKDYKFTLDMIRNRQHDGASIRGYYDDVESVELVNELTAVVRWKATLFQSIAYTLLEDTHLVPEFLFAYGEDGKRFPEETIGQEFNNHWFNRVGYCGCGPYRLAKYEAGQYFVLERFEDWYGVRDGIRFPLRRVKLGIYNDAESPLLKLKSGEMDMIGMRPAHYKNEILDAKDPKSPFLDGRIQHFRSPRPSFAFFGWKNTHPLFRDKRVRKALALACNRQDMCEKIFLNLYEPMAAPVYPGGKDAITDLAPLPFDLKAAAALLDEAGWKIDPSTGLRTNVVDGVKKTFSFTMNWPTPSPEFEATLNQYKNDLLSIGIKMESQPLQWSVYQKKTHDREFEACTQLWAEGGWESDFDQIWTTRQIQEPQSSNFIEFSNPELDTLSEQLKREMDLDKRTAIVHRIGHILYEEQPYCFFGWRFVIVAHWSYVKGVQARPFKIRPFLRTYPIWVDR
jgi:ABC-type transport system substrate-binding protein